MPFLNLYVRTNQLHLHIPLKTQLLQLKTITLRTRAHWLDVRIASIWRMRCASPKNQGINLTLFLN